MTETGEIDALPGPRERMRGFIAHLRLNGFTLGPSETALALDIVGRLERPTPGGVRAALKVALSGCREDWERFDDLFPVYWFGEGVKRATVLRGENTSTPKRARPALWDKVLPPEESVGRPIGAAAQAPGGSDAEEDTDSPSAPHRIAADRRDSLFKTDLREIAAKEDIAEAERVAERLAKAMRYRLSRRRKPSARGRSLDLRRTIRRNIAHGGEPVDLLRRTRPDRPVRVVVLLDVSGSMKLYSRYFLLFVRGLLSRWMRADAYLFHTRLVRVTEALTDKDPFRALAKLSLVIEGFGGGTRIAGALADFNARYAKEAIDSRTVVVILSDGYDTEAPEDLARELKRLRTRARRIVWLNPLLGWKDYEPVARGMAAALPHIDHFAAANSLQALADLEPELAAI
jgi:uncharacterized protein with von Willebrand factor type A (vWA) domain